MARSHLISVPAAVSFALTLAFALPVCAGNVVVCGVPGDQYAPVLVSDEARGAIIVWRDGRNGASDLYAQRIDGASARLWVNDGVVISTRGFTEDVPSISGDGSGGLLVAWTDRKNSWDSLFVRRLSDAGTTLWSRFPDPTAHVPSGPRIVPSNFGGGLVFWAEYKNDSNGDDIYFESAPFSGATLLWNSPGDQYRISAIADGSGGAFISWHDQGGGDDIPWVQHVGVGAWPATPVTTSDVSSLASEGLPLVASSGEEVFVAWSTWPDEDLHVQRVGPGGIEWGPNGRALCVAPGRQGVPAAVSDSAGGFIFAWLDGRTSPPSLYAQRSDPAGNFQWSPNGNRLCTSCVVMSTPTMVSDGAGGAIVAWTDSRGADRDIYAQRITASGSLAWGPDGIAISSAPGSQVEAQVASDGAGGAIIAWTDRRSGTDADIYSQHVDGSGAEPVLAVAPRLVSNASLTVTPNPLRGAAEIALDLPGSDRVTVVVWDVAGRVVARLAEREFPAGRATLTWDGMAATGSRLPAGIYFAGAYSSRFRTNARIVVVD